MIQEQLFWSAEINLKNYPPLTENITTEVCIIGAGISGLTTAYLLNKSGKKVVIVDDGQVAGGQTVRTTAHITNALDDRYYNLENYLGQEEAALAASSHRAAIDFIASVVSLHQIDCDFQQVNAYLFKPPGDSSDELEKELQAAKRAGIDASMVSSSPLDSFDTGPALCFSDQAAFHPIKYLNRLCEILEASGLKIYCGTHVTTINSENGYTLETDQNKKIQASHVVVATNSPINNRFFPHLKQASYRTYVIAGQVPKGYVKPGLYYDTLDPYHYIRIAQDKNGNDILIVGGEDHRTGEEKEIFERFKTLESWTRERFPKLGEITYHWSGQVIEPVDCIAFIGRVSHDEEVYIITGDSGNGMTHGTIGGLLINDLIMQKKSPWEELYDPHRISIKAAPIFIEENANTFWQYKDWLTTSEEKTLNPGCGIVVREGLTKCALYKDEKGTVHRMSAVCPHLGAIIHWNESTCCWECPAHGSIFTAEGKVVQGPANSNLEILDSAETTDNKN